MSSGSVVSAAEPSEKSQDLGGLEDIYELMELQPAQSSMPATSVTQSNESVIEEENDGNTRYFMKSVNQANSGQKSDVVNKIFVLKPIAGPAQDKQARRPMRKRARAKVRWVNFELPGMEITSVNILILVSFFHVRF